MLHRQQVIFESTSTSGTWRFFMKICSRTFKGEDFLDSSRGTGNSTCPASDRPTHGDEEYHYHHSQEGGKLSPFVHIRDHPRSDQGRLCSQHFAHMGLSQECNIRLDYLTVSAPELSNNCGFDSMGQWKGREQMGLQLRLRSSQAEL